MKEEYDQVPGDLQHKEPREKVPSRKEGRVCDIGGSDGFREDLTFQLNDRRQT